MRHFRFLPVLCLLLTLFAASIGPVNVLAQSIDPAASRPAPEVKDPNKIYFPETGHYMNTVFNNYWQKYGGLAQFGYPFTEEFQERNPIDGQVYMVQYFERARFERHPEFSGTFYEVLLGHLGLQFTAGRTFQTTGAFPASRDRFYFPETRHSLSNGFKRYWENNGGLRIYGYPVSEEVIEGGLTVQYFERARFEYHPENSGTPYEVQLGLLGTNALQASGRRLPQTYRVQPEPASVVQGRTIQVNVSAAGVKSLKASLEGQSLAFLRFNDSYVAAAAVASNAPLRSRLLTTEITDNTGVVRRFEQPIGVKAGSFEQQTIELDPEVEASLGSEEDAIRERARVFGIYAQVTPDKLWTGKFVWPATGPVTTTFGSRRNYVGGGTEIHDGIDIGLAPNAPIRAPQRGRVVLAELQKVRGNIVILDHGLGLHTAYFHQSKIMVKVGDMVNQGDLIGLAGTTGLSTGTHLHWEMSIGTTRVDPSEWISRVFLNEPARPATSEGLIFRNQSGNRIV